MWAALATRRPWMDLLCGSRQPVDDEVFSVEPPQSPEAKFIADAWEPRERADDACALPERVDDDADSFADLPQMVEAATRREISRRRDSLSPNAVTDRLSALRVSRTTVARRRRRRRGQHGAADVPGPSDEAGRDAAASTRGLARPARRGGRGKPPDGRLAAARGAAAAESPPRAVLRAARAVAPTLSSRRRGETL